LGVAPSLLDFSYLMNGVKDISASLTDGNSDYYMGTASLDNTGELTIDPGNYGESLLVTFSVNVVDLANTNNVVLKEGNLPEPSSPSHPILVINVHGTEIDFSSMGFSIAMNERKNLIIWNFKDATSLSMRDIGVIGSIFAPKAHIQGISGVVWGHVIGKSWVGSMQLNWVRLSCPSEGYCVSTGGSGCGDKNNSGNNSGSGTNSEDGSGSNSDSGSNGDSGSNSDSQSDSSSGSVSSNSNRDRYSSSSASGPKPLSSYAWTLVIIVSTAIAMVGIGIW